MSLGGDVMKSSIIVSLDPQKSVPNAKFETGIDKPNVYSSPIKMNVKDGRRVDFESQQLSLDGYT